MASLELETDCQRPPPSTMMASVSGCGGRRPEDEDEGRLSTETIDSSESGNDDALAMPAGGRLHPAAWMILDPRWRAEEQALEATNTPTMIFPTLDS